MIVGTITSLPLWVVALVAGPWWLGVVGIAAAVLLLVAGLRVRGVFPKSGR